LVSKEPRTGDEPTLYRRKLILLFACGISLRLLFAPLSGFPGDTMQFVRWMHASVDWGMFSIYDPERVLDCNYPPTVPYMLRIVGEAERHYPALRVYPKLETLLVKIPPIALELALAGLLAWWAHRRFGKRESLWIAGAMLFNPAVIHLSAFWGQSDPIGFLPMLGALLAALSGGFALAGALAAVGLFTKFQGIVYLPLLALMLWRKGGFGALARCCVACVLVGLVWISPFIIKGNPHLERMFASAYSENVGRYPNLSMGAANVWALHPSPSTPDFHLPEFFYGEDGVVNARGLLLHFTWRRIGLLLFAAAGLASLVWYWRGREGKRWLPAAILISIAFFCLPTEMHERYLYPVLPLLALYCLERPEFKKLFWILTALFWVALACTAFPECLLFQHLAPVMLFVLVALVLALLLPREKWKCRTECWLARPRLGLLVAVLLILPFMFIWSWRAPSASRSVIYLDDMDFEVVHSQWRPPGRGQTIEHQALQLKGLVYRHGLGVHARSEISVTVPEGVREFVADVGIDAETLGNELSDVKFIIKAEDSVLLESPVMRADSQPHVVRVAVTPGQRLSLIVDPLERNHSDHADWANARFLR
jgi:Gpi18-like mannosyltransferase